MDRKWSPINFQIYSELFLDLINECCEEWLSENQLSTDVFYEVIFAHEVERDGGGAVLGESFVPISKETQWS
jgi:hypothetical protein